MSGLAGASGLAQPEGLDWIRSCGGPEATRSPLASNPRPRSLLCVTMTPSKGAFSSGAASELIFMKIVSRLSGVLELEGREAGELRQGELRELLGGCCGNVDFKKSSPVEREKRNR